MSLIKSSVYSAKILNVQRGERSVLRYSWRVRSWLMLNNVIRRTLWDLGKQTHSEATPTTLGPALHKVDRFGYDSRYLAAHEY